MFWQMPGTGARRQRYCSPEHQQLTALERRSTLHAIQARRAYRHARYLAQKPALNRSRAERRRRKRIAEIRTLPPNSTRRRRLLARYGIYPKPRKPCPPRTPHTNDAAPPPPPAPIPLYKQVKYARRALPDLMVQDHAEP
jgi:hypothetical protein